MHNAERLAIVLVLIGAASRLIHLPPNIAAVTGVTIFAGFAIRNIWLALAVPIAAMAIADFLLGFYAGVAFTYVGMAAGVLIARGLLKPLTPIRLIATTLLASCVFFLLSNFGTWAEGWYGYTWQGLFACYVAGLPFWQNSLVGDILSTALVFGVYLLAKRANPTFAVTA